jgi:hypothetical protein
LPLAAAEDKGCGAATPDKDDDGEACANGAALALLLEKGEDDAGAESLRRSGCSSSPLD